MFTIISSTNLIVILDFLDIFNIIFLSFSSGGFKLQLLDSKGRHVQDLTPPGEFVGDPLTRQTVIIVQRIE